MPIDPAKETLIKLNKAGEIVPGHPTICTLWRWYQEGVNGVRLETALVGGRRFTSREAIHRFIERGTAARDGEPAPACGGPIGR